MKKQIALSIALIVFVSLLNACQMNTTTPTNTDALTIPKIFEIAKQTSGYTWYKKSDAYLPKNGVSGHIEVFQRTRYDATAATQLDANGKVKAGAVFPEGSTIVKELVNSDRSISGYALMLKRKADPSADADGWVWGYVTAAGAERHPLSSKGNGCIACHSISGHIDRTLMNVSNP
ncbi:MAG: cytochrome P460 family protein [Ignavibacteria bacterium]|nr:cytochrome P460 family protein [Ignavibacteria bacterium]